MNTYDRFIRSQQIIALHRAGVSHKQVAEQYGITTRQVSRIIKEVTDAEKTQQDLEDKVTSLKQDLEEGSWL